MPTYTYRCKSCGHEFDELQKFSEERLVRCPSCNNDTLIRVIGGGAGLVFKGSGFYLTDYKKKSNSPAASETSKTSEKQESVPSGKEKKTEAKTETKVETKPDSKSGEKS